MLRRFRPKLPSAYEHADEDLRYAQDPECLEPGHRMRVLINGDEAFPDMVDAIKAAKHYVHLETYILQHDTVGELFAGALIERAKAGVVVRVMYDAFGSYGLSPSYLRRLRNAGVETVEYGPIGKWRNRRFWSRRDHRKIMIVDGRIGYVGGINIGDDYAPRDIGGKGWRDTHMRIEGPVVADLETMFRNIWLRQKGPEYPAYPREADETVASEGTEFCHAVGTDLRGRRSAIRRHYLHAIRRAKRQVSIANAYFVPDLAIRRALGAAVARGVNVQIIVSMVSDVKMVQYAGEYTYARLLKDGVRVHGWHDAHLHSKVAVIDGAWSAVGSYNLDYISLFQNLEVIAEIVGREFGATMDKMFADDFSRCTEIQLADWKRRPWWRKALSWLAYRFRRWL